MAAPSVVKVGRIPNGYRIRVEGRGTMRESPAVQQFATRTFAEPGTTLVVDLSDCNYLDSTFLGCLVVLHRAQNRHAPPRLSIVPSDAVMKRTLVPNNLQGVFHLAETCPAIVGVDQVIPPVILEPAEMGRHALEAHRLLAEIDSTNQRLPRRRRPDRTRTHARPVLSGGKDSLRSCSIVAPNEPNFRANFGLRASSGVGFDRRVKRGSRKSIIESDERSRRGSSARS